MIPVKEGGSRRTCHPEPVRRLRSCDRPAPDDAPVELRIAGLARLLRLYVHGEETRYLSRRLRAEGIWDPMKPHCCSPACSRAMCFCRCGGQYRLLPGHCRHRGGGGRRHWRLSRAGPISACCARQPASQPPGDHRSNAFAAGLADGPAGLFVPGSEDNAGDHQVFAAAAGRRSVPDQAFTAAIPQAAAVLARICSGSMCRAPSSR